MPGDNAGDIEAIAEMLHIDLLKENYSEDKPIPISQLKDMAADYIESLEVSCSAVKVLAKMQSIGLVIRKKKEYLIQQYYYG